MSKLDRVIADVESVLEKLGGVQNRLRELKGDAEAVEKARDSLRKPRSKRTTAINRTTSASVPHVLGARFLLVI